MNESSEAVKSLLINYNRPVGHKEGITFTFQNVYFGIYINEDLMRHSGKKIIVTISDWFDHYVIDFAGWENGVEEILSKAKIRTRCLTDNKDFRMEYNENEQELTIHVFGLENRTRISLDFSESR